LDDTFCSVAYTPRKFNKGSVLPEKASHADASTQAGEKAALHLGSAGQTVGSPRITASLIGPQAC
jgi:hypothetical protein